MITNYSKFVKDPGGTIKRDVQKTQTVSVTQSMVIICRKKMKRIVEVREPVAHGKIYQAR